MHRKDILCVIGASGDAGSAMLRIDSNAIRSAAAAAGSVRRSQVTSLSSISRHYEVDDVEAAWVWCGLYGVMW